MAWLPGYAYRKPLVITGGTSGAQTDFQIDLAVAHVTDHMQTDFDDLRFTQNDGTTLIDAWLESKINGTSAEVWIKAPSTPANGVDADPLYMNYGNAGASSNWDGNATFIIFDDFLSSAYDATDWSERGSPSISYPDSTTIRILRPSSAWTADGYGLHSDNPMTDNVAFRRKVSAGEEYCMGFWFSTGNYIRFYHYTFVDDCRVSKWVGGSETIITSGLTNKPTGIVEIRRDGQSYNFTVDGVSLWSDSITNFSGNSNIQLDQAVTGSIYSDTDWALVRKYVSNPPTYAFGSEESATSIPVIMRHCRNMRL